MEIHGGIPAQFLVCDAGTLRELSQHVVHSAFAGQNALRLQKARESLDLKLEPSSECMLQSFGGTGHTPILGSPELNLLKLESPELERLIMSQQGEEVLQSMPQRGSNNTAQSLMSQLELNSNRNAKAISPIISQDDFRFITETNRALESILPKSRDDIDDNESHSFVFGMENFLEPMQQVPGNLEAERHLLVQTEADSSLLDMRQHQSRLTVKQNNERSLKASVSPNSLFQSGNDSHEGGYERIGNTETILESNAHIVYDMAQPSMVPNPYTQSNVEREKGSRLAMLPLPPIDLEVQEIVKRERKKLKNRVAASKCRKKKLEREAQLEVRVQQLKERNIELNALANALRQQAGELRQRILDHVNTGCPGTLMHY